MLPFKWRQKHHLVSPIGSVPECEAQSPCKIPGGTQSVERLTAEREVAVSIPGTGPTLRVFKYLRNEGTSFALQTAGSSRGSNDNVKWQSRLQGA